MSIPGVESPQNLRGNDIFRVWRFNGDVGVLSVCGLTNESKLCSIADEKIYFFYGQTKLGVEVAESIA